MPNEQAFAAARKASPTHVPPRDLDSDGDQSSLAQIAVLVVEDDLSNAKLMSAILRGEGGEVRVAASAEEALVVLETFRPHVIVLDLVLPLMSGIALAQTLKAAPATRDIAIIAVSAFNGRATELLAHEVGCAAYLRKPIDALSFSRLLLSHIGGPK